MIAANAANAKNTLDAAIFVNVVNAINAGNVVVASVVVNAVNVVMSANVVIVVSVVNAAKHINVLKLNSGRQLNLYVNAVSTIFVLK